MLYCLPTIPHFPHFPPLSPPISPQPIWHTMQHELLCFLVPFFMANHPNSSSILHFAWQGAAVSSPTCSDLHMVVVHLVKEPRVLVLPPVVQSDPSIVRQLMSNAIADWYLRSDTPPDHSKLSKILDVTQDLKALSNLLNNAQFSFVLDLACLAAKREYLKLDKWVTDKIREHQVNLQYVFPEPLHVLRLVLLWAVFQLLRCPICRSPSLLPA